MLATKKLLDRMPQLIEAPVSVPTTRLGNWFAKPLFWRPQYALFVSEITFLSVLSPLAPSSSLANRFPDDAAAMLRVLGVAEWIIEEELAEMDDIVVSRTNSRQVVGVLNELALIANNVRRLHPEMSALQIALALSEVPLGIHGKEYRFPSVALADLMVSASKS